MLTSTAPSTTAKQVPPGLPSVKTMVSLARSQRRASRNRRCNLRQREFCKRVECLQCGRLDSARWLAFARRSKHLTGGTRRQAGRGPLKRQRFRYLPIDAFQLLAQRRSDAPKAGPLREEQWIVAQQTPRREYLFRQPVRNDVCHSHLGRGLAGRRRIAAAISIVAGRDDHPGAQKADARQSVRRERHGTNPFGCRRLAHEFRIEAVAQCDQTRMNCPGTPAR